MGLFAIQLARYIATETGKVVVSCSSGNVDFVKQYGADDAVDYTSVQVPIYLSQNYSTAPFDLILDCVGSSFDLFSASPAFLKPKGEFVVIGAPVPHSFSGMVVMIFKVAKAMFLPHILGGVPRRYNLLMMDVTKDKVENVGKLVDEKKLKPTLDSIWDFNDEGIKAAYTKIMTRHARGKVVIRLT